MELRYDGFGKSKHNACPVCGLPRGAGPHEFAHGKCAEERAKTEGKKNAGVKHPNFSRITVEQREKAADNRAKKYYKSGRLPKWMFE